MLPPANPLKQPYIYVAQDDEVKRVALVQVKANADSTRFPAREQWNLTVSPSGYGTHCRESILFAAKRLYKTFPLITATRTNRCPWE